MLEDSIKAASELAKKYRSITIEDLEKVVDTDDGDEPSEVLSRITGFGDKTKCPICNSVNYDCSKCIYSIKKNPETIKHCYCTDDISYDNIVDAGSFEELLEAIKIRADYIENLIEYIKNSYETKK